MRYGKTPGTKWKQERSHNRRDEKRREDRINAYFFYDLPYLNATAGYFVSKRITSAMCPHIFRHRAPNLLHPFLPRYYMSPLFRSSPRAAFTEGDAPTFRHNKFVPRLCLTRFASRGRDSRGKTYKTFPARFLPSVMFSAKEGLDLMRDGSRSLIHINCVSRQDLIVRFFNPFHSELFHQLPSCDRF